MEAQFPDTDTEASRQGTYLHELAEIFLTHPGITRAEAMRLQAVGKTGPSLVITTDQLDMVDLYVRTCESIASEATRVWVEQRVDLGGGVWGTADFIALVGNSLIVVDLKTGSRPVQAEGNWKLAIYALAAVNTLAESVPEVTAVDTVEMVIVQPAVSATPSSWLVTWDDLLALNEKTVAPGIAAANDPSAPLRAGNHCHFCKARTGCPALREHVQQEARELFPRADLTPVQAPPAPSTLSHSDLARLFGARKMIDGWLDDVERELEARLVRGEMPDLGLKVVERLSNRKWRDEATAVAVLKANGIDPYKQDLRSPADVEKMLGRSKGNTGAAKAVVEPLTVRVPIGLAVVPASDKRPAAAGTTKIEFPTDEVV